MFFNKKSILVPRIDCLINADSVVDGNIMFSGGLRVDGIVKGSIIIHEGKSGALIVAQNAKVDGRVVVTYAIIDGKVQGDIIAQDFLRLGVNARVSGDITYQTLEMHHGAVVSGKLIHADSKPKLPRLGKASHNEKSGRGEHANAKPKTASAKIRVVEKAPIAKAPMEKTPIAKAPMEKVSIEKVSLEKAPTEKVIGQRAIASRAISPRAVSQKVAGEKAAHEKALGEKLTLENVGYEKVGSTNYIKPKPPASRKTATEEKTGSAANVKPKQPRSSAKIPEISVPNRIRS